MKQLKNKVKKVLMKVASFLPSRLPQGMTEFGIWADSIIYAYDIPDNDSMRFALATQILHAESGRAYRPKRLFAMQLYKAMSNQVAAGIMQELKDKQVALAAVEQQQQAKVAQEASNVQPIK